MSTDPLDLLAAAQPVDVPIGLEQRILRRVAARRRRSVWVMRVAAAAAMLLWAAQGYVFLGHDDLEAGENAVAELSVEEDAYSEPLAYLLDLPDNTLYSE